MKRRDHGRCRVADLRGSFWGAPGRYMPKSMLLAFVEEMGHSYGALLEGAMEGDDADEEIPAEVALVAANNQIELSHRERGVGGEVEEEESEGEEADKGRGGGGRGVRGSGAGRASSGGHGRYQRKHPSVSSYAPSGTTFSTFSPSMIARDSMGSQFYPRTSSVASSRRRSK